SDDIYSILLNETLDPAVALYALHVRQDVEALDVFFLSSHAITDATSLVELHSCLAHLIDCIIRGLEPAVDEQPFPDPIDDAVDRALAELPRDALGDQPSFAGQFAQLPMLSGKPARHNLERLVIEPDDLLRIAATAHAANSSIHSFLVAAYAHAIRNV